MADQYFSFNPNKEERFEEKINLDSLFEKKRQHNLSRLSVYQKILHRIHERIKHTARQRNSDDFCFYVVPEFMFGVPRYDVQTCIQYVMDKLQENGFAVKYTHPNLLFISWKHYIPAYQRDEIRKQTGYRIDGFGKVLSKDNGEKREKEHRPFHNETSVSTSTKRPTESPVQSKRVSFSKSNNEYRDVKSYRPSGNFVYDEDLLKSLNEKLKAEDAALSDIEEI